MLQFRRWNDSIERSFRPFLRSLGENLPSCPFVVLELDSCGVLQGVSRAHTVPDDVRLTHSDGGEIKKLTSTHNPRL